MLSYVFEGIYIFFRTVNTYLLNRTPKLHLCSWGLEVSTLLGETFLQTLDTVGKGLEVSQENVVTLRSVKGFRIT